MGARRRTLGRRGEALDCLERALSPDEVERTGTEIILANTYHLMLRPGVDLIRAAGGLHRFMAWPRPILTDSGGFQVFSLAHRRSVSEQGVTFRSHIDGSLHELSPELAIDLQLGFGSDIIMPLDELIETVVVPAAAPRHEVTHVEELLKGASVAARVVSL